MPLYLGLDCSTQGLTATVIEVEPRARRVRTERSIIFERAFPHYGTARGVLRSNADPRVVFAPPPMWVEALDALMQEIASALGDDVRRIEAVSGSAQQHGSVYLNGRAAATLAGLEAAASLVAQLAGVFSRDEAPVWMDSSTTTQCAEITEAIGGEAAVAALTGSRAFERFTGPQIRKFFETDPGGYAQTARIHLVSSFMASLLSGGGAPIDHGDARRIAARDRRER